MAPRWPLFLLLPFLLPPAAPARGAEHTILVGNFAFTPSRLTVAAGDTVRWVNTGGHHNVLAEDGSFTSGDAAGADAPNWPFVHRFDRPGVFPFLCVPHETFGMRGVIEVDGAAHPGIPEFDETSFRVSEAEDAAVVRVRRAKGSAGAISVAYRAASAAASPGNATDGVDFTAVSGVLTWAAGESADRTFEVPLRADTTLEGDESVSLTLSQATGGATLDPRSRTATLIIADDDGPVARSPAEVRCDAARLKAFLSRARATSPRTGSTGLNLSLSDTGDFAGLAHVALRGGGPEAHLAFSTNPETPLRRNPAGPLQPAVSLSRNAGSSDLVRAGSPGELVVVLQPTAAGAAEALLRLNNLTAGQAIPSETRSLPAPLPWLTPCHGKLAPRDLHVARVLTRLARAVSAGAESVELAIWRAEEADTFRLDVHPVGPGGAALGQMAVELKVTSSSTGEMLGGTLRLLGRCAAGQTEDCTSVTRRTELSLVPPSASGQAPRPAAARVFTLGTEGSGQPTATVDWVALLAGTAWRRPI